MEVIDAQETLEALTWADSHKSGRAHSLCLHAQITSFAGFVESHRVERLGGTCCCALFAYEPKASECRPGEKSILTFRYSRPTKVVAHLSSIYVFY
jgi:hypothetical protein